MFALGRNNPEAAGSRYVQISLLINLHAVECVFALGRGHVEKDFSVRQSAIGVHFVSHDDLLLSVPIVDVEVLLIWREGQTVRSLQIGGQQLDLLAIWRDAEYTAVGQFFTWIIEELRQPKRWIGEIQRSIRLVDEIVGTVEPPPFIAISEDCELAILLHTNHATTLPIENHRSPPRRHMERSRR